MDKVVTKQERKVLKLIAEGHTNADTAQLLCLSINTVKRHVSNIMDKLTAYNRTQAVVTAMKRGII